MNKFVFTCGDINGIGPEIVIKTLNQISRYKTPQKFYFICPSNIFQAVALRIKPTFDYEIVNQKYRDSSAVVTVINSGTAKQSIGKPTITSGKASYKSLVISYELLKRGDAGAVITAPISKTAIKMAGINFSGQTEMFARWSNTKNYAMTFLSKKMCAALFPIHNPLQDVSNLLNYKKLDALADVVISTLKIDLQVLKPKIAVLGLNPHAGENGIIGKEEIDIISPVIKKHAKSVSIEGPFSSDAFFGSKAYKNYDMIIGMYHDQVLIPFKLLNFGGGVNYTAGLPIVRTSPDHGVAYDIAGKFIADESSILQAFKYAKRIVNNRKKKNG
ncbi:MAG: 4-hydroxythreonine-4-phosphate dehydrogenase PdxA [Ignavibacteriae bacterium]|nr:MAG: 4-hydroxythreonine-4-phosphate dehydrogenase PdxA [Ignavibacteriota bacterium]